MVDRPLGRMKMIGAKCAVLPEGGLSVAVIVALTDARLSGAMG